MAAINVHYASFIFGLSMWKMPLISGAVEAIRQLPAGVDVCGRQMAWQQAVARFNIPWHR